MDAQTLKDTIGRGEGPRVEFKRCGANPGQDVFESVCAFANHFGGTILLGVDDSGEIVGVGDRANELERNVANVTNNEKLFRPTPMVETEPINVDGVTVVRIWVPSGPSVYRFKGEVYDRIADADVKISSSTRITSIGIRKQQVYTEQQPFPHLGIEALRKDLIERSRELAARRQAGHPWAHMDDEELLRSARLITSDAETGETGINRAAILLLGTDDVIGTVCPAYRTDAIWVQDEAVRYADRLLVTTNLIEARDQLLRFCQEHTDDPFYLDGTQAVSVRDVVCRELVTNMLIHREFLSPVTAQLRIDKTGITTRNASRAAFDGPVTMRNLAPVPKNPIIAGFFLQMGYAEELGSGVRNLYRYSRHFMGADPELEEGDVFTAFIPDARSDKAGRASDNSTVRAILAILDERGEVSSSEVAKLAGVSTRTASSWLRKMVDDGVLLPVGNTSTRRYVRP